MSRRPASGREGGLAQHDHLPGIAGHGRGSNRHSHLDGRPYRPQPSSDRSLARHVQSLPLALAVPGLRTPDRNSRCRQYRVIGAENTVHGTVETRIVAVT